MNEPNKSLLLPRIDLREPAFRRYELIIAEACRGSFIYDPQAKMGIKPYTFTARFRDALRGYRLYHYTSDFIPKDFDTTVISCDETIDGRVYIRCETLTLPKYNTKLTTESEVIALMQRIAAKEIPMADLPIKIGYSTTEERDRILSWASQHHDIDCHVRDHNNEINFYTF